ncbi:uncharacterized protein LOC127812853 [Diospyros lotus]|uniref:uncharacterized protein LOC127812853 n=1 Tax=Diospyros lotus TaxID=55363 RepID=UPI0022584025|nr:uncharacterized protein LOC127812853 [Diospyros lotus]
MERSENLMKFVGSFFQLPEAESNHILFLAASVKFTHPNFFQPTHLPASHALLDLSSPSSLALAHGSPSLPLALCLLSSCSSARAHPRSPSLLLSLALARCLSPSLSVAFALARPPALAAFLLLSLALALRLSCCRLPSLPLALALCLFFSHSLSSSRCLSLTLSLTASRPRSLPDCLSLAFARPRPHARSASRLRHLARCPASDSGLRFTPPQASRFASFEPSYPVGLYSAEIEKKGLKEQRSEKRD